MAEYKEETIEELEEKIRVKKDKLAKSEAHSNKRSTKTKSLKESQLKGSIKEAEKRLQTALDKRAEQDIVQEEQIIQAVNKQEEIQEPDIKKEASQENTSEPEKQQEKIVPESQKCAEDEIEKYYKAFSRGNPYQCEDKDIDKIVEGLKLALDDRYDYLLDRKISDASKRGEMLSKEDAKAGLKDQYGNKILSVEETRDAVNSETKERSYCSGYLRLTKGELNGIIKDSFDKLDSSTNQQEGFYNVKREVDDLIRKVCRQIGVFDFDRQRQEKYEYGELAKQQLAMHLGEVAKSYCELEKLHEFVKEIGQKKEDIGMHEFHIGEFSNSTTENVEVKKKGVAGLFGKKETVEQTRDATRDEMFERKVQAEEKLQEKLENGEINEQCFDQVSGALDRLYGVEPEKVSQEDLLAAKEEAGIQEFEPVIEEMKMDKGENELQTTENFEEDGLD